jgi:hypothetical protein
MTTLTSLAAEVVIRDRLARSHSLHTIEIGRIEKLANGGTLVTFFCGQAYPDGPGAYHRVAYWSKGRGYDDLPEWDMIAS